MFSTGSFNLSFPRGVEVQNEPVGNCIDDLTIYDSDYDYNPYLITAVSNTYVYSGYILISVNVADGNLYGVNSVIDSASGNDLAGGQVTVFFNETSSETATFIGYPGNLTSIATGTGWSLRSTGNTNFINTFNFSSTTGIQKIYIDLATANAVFDMTYSPDLTPGSGAGLRFQVSSTSHVTLLNVNSIDVVKAIYKNKVVRLGDIYGDLYTSLQIEFISNYYGTRTLTGNISFGSDSDKVVSLIPYCPPPEQTCYNEIINYGNVNPIGVDSLNSQELEFYNYETDTIDAIAYTNAIATTGNVYVVFVIDQAGVTGNTLVGGEVTVFFANGDSNTAILQLSSGDGNPAGYYTGDPEYYQPGANAIGNGWHISLHGDTYQNPWFFSTTNPVNKIYINLVTANAMFDVKYEEYTPGSLEGQYFYIDVDSQYVPGGPYLKDNAVALNEDGSNLVIRATYTDRLFLAEQPNIDLLTKLTVEFFNGNTTVPYGYIGTLLFNSDTDTAKTQILPYCEINANVAVNGLSLVPSLGDTEFYINITCTTLDQGIVIFNGINETPGETASGAPLQQRQVFQSFLRDVKIEDFESFSSDPSGTSTTGGIGLKFGEVANVAVIRDSESSIFPGLLWGVFKGNYDGRFNTSTTGGTNGGYFESPYDFYIDFSSNPVSAFGFYGTDIGSDGGTLSVKLTDINNQEQTFNINSPINANGGQLTFWGFIDPSKSYKRIDFLNSRANAILESNLDTFGFDDFVIGIPKICGESLFTLTYDTSLNSNAPVQLPLNGTVDVIIDWGDGSINSYESPTVASHQYASADSYDITIFGSLTSFGSSSINQTSLVSVTDWGELGLQNLSYAFNNAINLSFVPSEIPTTVNNVSGMFSGCQSFNGGVDNWNTANILDMSKMFESCIAFNADIGGWNTSKVTNTSGMFKNCYSFDRNLNSWNVANVTTMSSMFESASVFNYSLNSWNVSKVTDMSSMFKQATVFNSSINSWNIKALNMDSIFESATSFNVDITSWNVATVLSMNSMFKNATSFINDLSNWCVINISTQPTDFALNSPLAGNPSYLPLWGTCSNIPNSVELTVPSLDVSVPTSGGHLSNNVAWYNFTLSTESNITISTSGSVDTMIGLYDVTGALIEFDDDDGPGTLSYINKILSPGIYYIAIGQYYVSYVIDNFAAVGYNPVPTGMFISITN